MIYLTLAGRAVDCDLDLTSPQRHVLQKLLTWEHLGLKLEDFAARRAKALEQGWGGLGPVEQTPAFAAVAGDLAARLAIRHGQAAPPGWLKAQLWPGRYAGGGLEPGRTEAGRLEVVVRDAADLERGRLWLDMGPEETPEQVVGRAWAGGGLLGELAVLGLVMRA
ncbi:MAG: hypothetical protein HY910_00710 [Desulfarculus sp.]|nr:hypothetical protein [Desulfarculus sp.]